jgi:cytochrome c biogenesis protein CcmG, thiol:disulfide interchange protein DsbE
MRRIAFMLVVASVLGAGFIGCSSSKPEKSASTEDFSKLAGAPAPLAAVYRQQDRLLDGGQDALDAQLAKLKGRPVVVNAWASWCGPCRFEFPYFQKQAIKRGKKIGFLGVNTNDNDGNARKFLEKYPLPYPSFRDPDEKIAGGLHVVGLPATAYYDRQGDLAYLHQGVYTTEAKLAQDIERYAR